MQIPPHRSLLVRQFPRPHAEAAKYVRNEFGDKNPSWLLAEASNNDHAKDCGDPKKTTIGENITPELPSQVLMGDGCGADH